MLYFLSFDSLDSLYLRFLPLREWLEFLGLRYHVNPKGMHATKIERFIRVVKEIARTILHGLKYRMPEEHTGYLITEVVATTHVQHDEMC